MAAPTNSFRPPAQAGSALVSRREGGVSLVDAALGVATTIVGVADDAVFGPAIAAGAALVGTLPAFVVAALVTLGLNWALGAWLLSRWDTWFEARGSAVAAKVARLREHRWLRRPAAWATAGPVLPLAAAGALLGTIAAVAAVRLAGPPARPQRLLAVTSAAYGLFFAAVYSGAGTVVESVARALL